MIFSRWPRCSPRRSLFRRMTEGAGALEQVVAANIDTVFIVNAVDGRLSAPHLQRYLTLVSGSGALPVVVVTKADLASAEVVQDWVEAIEAAAPGVPVVVVSTATGRGMEDLAGYLLPGRTVALLGLSGAGKSTMVNVLAGAAVLATGQVRADGQGRHVTTHRQLVLLPGGGLIIDTPGMRALSVWGAGEGIRLAFADLEGLAGKCDFADCSHRSEQGCAVRAAMVSGLVTAGRLEELARTPCAIPGARPPRGAPAGAQSKAKEGGRQAGAARRSHGNREDAADCGRWHRWSHRRFEWSATVTRRHPGSRARADRGPRPPRSCSNPPDKEHQDHGFDA